MSQQPPMRTSEESSRDQLELARRQGEALQAALEEMNEESDSGVLTQKAGDYEIGLAVEEAEGMWQWQDGELRWQNPRDENCHVEVCVRDRADGRFIPGLEVAVTLIDPDGAESEPQQQPFLWHPWLYHYGRNWRVAGAGEYRIRIRVEPPRFMRHDHENGRRYLEPVEVEFDGVEIDPDQKTVD
ncbi:MAG: iron transporter [Gaiellaceae bacterium]